MHPVYRITVHKIHLSRARVRRWESKRRICAMGRATSARRTDPPYTILYRGGGYTGRPKPSATARVRDPDPRYNGGRCRAPFIRLHEKFRTHIPRCSVSFAAAGSLSSDRPVSKAIGRARSSVRVRVFGHCTTRMCSSWITYVPYVLYRIHMGRRRAVTALPLY